MPDPVTPQGNQDPPALGWRAALPDEYKEHEFVKTFQKPGDFVKTAIEIKADRDSLKTKLENSIPKLAADAKPEEQEAYYKALGRPDKPEGYELDGDHQDEKTVAWARNAFHKAGLNGTQAKTLSAEWNGFIASMVAAETETRQKEREAADAKLKTELGDRYDGSIEGVRRAWKKFTDTEFDAFVNETKIGNDPRLIRFMLKVSKAIGEDTSPAGSPPKGKDAVKGIVYDKSPDPKAP